MTLAQASASLWRSKHPRDGYACRSAAYIWPSCGAVEKPLFVQFSMRLGVVRVVTDGFESGLYVRELRIASY